MTSHTSTLPLPRDHPAQTHLLEATHTLDTHTHTHTHATQKPPKAPWHVYSKPRMCPDDYRCIALNLTTKHSLTMCVYYSGQCGSHSNLRMVIRQTLTEWTACTCLITCAHIHLFLPFVPNNQAVQLAAPTMESHRCGNGVGGGAARALTGDRTPKRLPVTL